MKGYYVKWRKVAGVYQERRFFFTRGEAVTYLNHVILDLGEVDAVLKMMLLGDLP